MGHLMVVDAKDEAAVQFYEQLGFERLMDDPSRLIRAL
jgi:ribosomal protein S18 acetylase RimI-like enzyme